MASMELPHANHHLHLLQPRVPVHLGGRSLPWEELGEGDGWGSLKEELCHVVAKGSYVTDGEELTQG